MNCLLNKFQCLIECFLVAASGKRPHRRRALELLDEELEDELELELEDVPELLLLLELELLLKVLAGLP